MFWAGLFIVVRAVLGIVGCLAVMLASAQCQVAPLSPTCDNQKASTHFQVSSWGGDPNCSHLRTTGLITPPLFFT